MRNRERERERNKERQREREKEKLINAKKGKIRKNMRETR